MRVRSSVLPEVALAILALEGPRLWRNERSWRRCPIGEREKGAVAAMTHRCAIWTLTSTWGMPLGRATRAGITTAS